MILKNTVLNERSQTPDLRVEWVHLYDTLEKANI